MKRVQKEPVENKVSAAPDPHSARKRCMCVCVYERYKQEGRKEGVLFWCFVYGDPHRGWPSGGDQPITYYTGRPILERLVFPIQRKKCVKCARVLVTPSEGGVRACSSTSWGEDKGSQLIGTVANSFNDMLKSFKQ